MRVLDFVGYKTFAWVTLTCLRRIALVYIAVEAAVLHKQVCTDLFKVDKSHVAVVGINPGLVWNKKRLFLTPGYAP